MLKARMKLFLATMFAALFVFFFGGATQMLHIGKADSGVQFAMQGASMRLTDVTGMRFEARINEYDENATYGMMICPTEYLDGVEADYIDALTEKYNAGTIKHLPLVMESKPAKVAESEWVIRGTISSVLYQNLNRNFTGIAFKRTGAEGSYVYEYATTYFDRSIAFISTASWNAKEFAEGTTQLETLKGMVAQCIALANNQTAEQANEIIANPASVSAYIQSNVTAVMNDIPTAYYEVGAEQELSATVTPAIGLNVTFATSDEDVVAIDGNMMKVVGNGNATVSVCIGDVVLAEKEISVSAITLSAPEYLAAGKTATVTASDDNANITYVSSNTSILTIDGNTIKGVGNGTATISAMVGGVAISQVSVRVIDFGYATGNLVDFASEEYIDLWKFADATNDGNASITYVENVSDGTDNGGYMYSGIRYSRPNNTGAYRTLGNMIYLSPVIIDMAKDLGYKYLQFFAYESTNASGSFRSYATAANGSAYYSGGHKELLSVNYTGWKSLVIDLESANCVDGTGIGFFGFTQNTYLAMVRFVGAGVDTDYAATVLTDADGDGKGDIVCTPEMVGKMFISSNTAQCTLTYNATGGYSDGARITFTRTGASWDQYNNKNHLEINSDWIMAAQALGYSKIAFRIKSPTSSYTVNRYNGAGSRVKYFNRNDNYVQLIFDISGFVKGDSIQFCMGSNAELSISDVSFRTAAHVTKPNLTW